MVDALLVSQGVAMPVKVTSIQFGQRMLANAGDRAHRPG